MAVVFTPEVTVADRRYPSNGVADRRHVTDGIAAFGTNSLVGVAAYAFNVPLRHVYAMLWRAGLLEIVE
jgi:hypothetical protein